MKNVKGFVGSLHGLDIRNLIQMCTVNGVTGRVKILGGDQEGEIYFDRGEIVHAACGELKGIEGLKAIIGWEGGEIKLEPGVTPPEVTIDLPWQALLMNAGKMAEKGHPEGDQEPPRERSASDTLRQYALYSEILRWREVENCLLLNSEGEILRPSTIPERMKRWAKDFLEIYSHSTTLAIAGSRSLPLYLSVTVDGHHWLIIPLGAHLLALQVPRSLNPKELLLRVTQALGEIEERP